MFFRVPDDGQSPKNTVMQNVIQPHQNPFNWLKLVGHDAQVFCMANLHPCHRVEHYIVMYSAVFLTEFA
jgi:hypothetical protein